MLLRSAKTGLQNPFVIRSDVLTKRTKSKAKVLEQASGCRKVFILRRSNSDGESQHCRTRVDTFDKSPWRCCRRVCQNMDATSETAGCDAFCLKCQERAIIRVYIAIAQSEL